MQLDNKRLTIAAQYPKAKEQRSLELDGYFCFDLPTVIGKFFCPFRGVFRRNINKEKRLPLVATAWLIRSRRGSQVSTAACCPSWSKQDRAVRESSRICPDVWHCDVASSRCNQSSCSDGWVTSHHLVPTKEAQLKKAIRQRKTNERTTLWA